MWVAKWIIIIIIIPALTLCSLRTGLLSCSSNIPRMNFALFYFLEERKVWQIFHVSILLSSKGWGYKVSWHLTVILAQFERECLWNTWRISVWTKIREEKQVYHYAFCCGDETSWPKALRRKSLFGLWFQRDTGPSWQGGVEACDKCESGHRKLRSVDL